MSQEVTTTLPDSTPVLSFSLAVTLSASTLISQFCLIGAGAAAMAILQAVKTETTSKSFFIFPVPPSPDEHDLAASAVPGLGHNEIGPPARCPKVPGRSPSDGHGPRRD